MSQPIGALNKINVIGQPRRIGAYGFFVTFHRHQRGAVFKSHRQMDNARRDFEFRDIAELFLQPEQ
ncbi:hypothetical protein D3C75_800310 [compost metagenome]